MSTISPLPSASTAPARDSDPPLQSTEASSKAAVTSEAPQTAPPPNTLAAPAKPKPAEKKGPLNFKDALGYLDDVKAAFVQRPEVYNQFLDIMKEFKCMTIDTPGVIDRVQTLFRGSIHLIQGFNTFLPPGYRIDCFTADTEYPDGHIVITTPSGETKLKPGDRFNPPRSGRNMPPELRTSPATLPISSAVKPSAVIEASSSVAPKAPIAGPSNSAVAATSRPAPVVAAAVKRKVPEFYHAVDFVNKIKKRFNDNNVTYNRFLRILQDYQLDRKEIANVHSEVSALFAHEADLLVDFKMFLPTPAGAADVTAPPQPPEPKKTVAKRQPVEDQPPPVKKRKAPVAESATNAPTKTRPTRRARGTARTVADPSRTVDPVTWTPSVVEDSSVRDEPVQAGRAANMANWPPYGEQDLEAVQQQHAEAERALAAKNQAPRQSAEDIAFYEKLARYFDDKTVYHEFLKLLNLYSQDIIDLFTLVSRAQLFLQPYAEAWTEFKTMVGWKDGLIYRGGVVENGKWVIENVPAMSYEGTRPNVSNSERCGPSYRRLPKTTTPTPCSGRDALCWDVLNDEWISLPGTLSDDGFVVGRKNEFETALHRTEEDRYEYDYHIEANLRTIALLEPIAQRLAFMEPQDRETFRLKAGLGGQSKSIYQGIIKKVYGLDAGLHVIQALHENPCQAVPIVLARLKQKDEEWKRALREWNRVWRETDAINYDRSLDVQGISMKANDKKNFSAKSYVQEIETIKREQQHRRIAETVGPRIADAPRHQLEYHVRNWPLNDVVKLFLSHLDHTASSYSDIDKRHIEAFFRTFVRVMFTYGPNDGFTNVIDDEASLAETRLFNPSQPPFRDIFNLSNLPDDSTNWKLRTNKQARYNFFCGSPHFTLLRMLVTLTDRLDHLQHVDYAYFRQGIEDATAVEDMEEDELPAESEFRMFAGHAVGIGGFRRDRLHRYRTCLHLLERQFAGELDNTAFEGHIRTSIKKDGHLLFTFDRCLTAMTRIIWTLVDPGSAYHKHYDQIFDLLKTDRSRIDTTTQEQLTYRTSVEVVVGTDENLYRVEWIPDTHALNFQLLGKDEILPEDEEHLQRQWQAYTKAFVSAGDSQGKTNPQALNRLLPRNIRRGPPTTSNAVRAATTLEMKVCLRSLRLLFVPGGEDWFFRKQTPPIPDSSKRTKRFQRWLDKNLEAKSSSDSAPSVDLTQSHTPVAATSTVSEQAQPLVEKPPPDLLASTSTVQDNSVSSAMDIDKL